VVCYEYLVDDCYYYCVALGGWLLCFARRRLVDTHTARDRRNLSGRLAVDRQETVEITLLSFFIPDKLAKQTVT
jgi:hypothetical protein